MASSGTKFAALSLAAAFAVAAGSWAWTQHQRSEVRRGAGALARDASESLRAGLDTATGVAKLETDARAIDDGLAEFGRVKASGERALAYGAEEYARSARQILVELAHERRARERVAAGIQALAAHMSYADRRTTDFHRRALELKQQLERAYYDYKVAADALARELDALPDARAKLATQIDASALLDAGLAEDARRRAVDTARRVADDMERARRITGAR